MFKNLVELAKECPGYIVGVSGWRYQNRLETLPLTANSLEECQTTLNLIIDLYEQILHFPARVYQPDHKVVTFKL